MNDHEDVWEKLHRQWVDNGSRVSAFSRPPEPTTLPGTDARSCTSAVQAFYACELPEGHATAHSISKIFPGEGFVTWEREEGSCIVTRTEHPSDFEENAQ